jgi:hypothetical protein
MKFKEPRCKDTDPHLMKIRDVAPSENIRCEVGSGECSELAIESQDNGCGGEFFLCKQHAIEFEQFARLVAEMTPNQVTVLEDSIKKAMNE